VTKPEYIARMVRDFGVSRSTAARWWRAIQSIRRASPQQGTKMVRTAEQGP
jgi:transposase-like protein